MLCCNIQSEVCGRSSEGINNYFLVCSCDEKNWRGFFRLESCLKVPLISFEFLWSKPLGGGEALKRKQGDRVEFTTPSCRCRELHGRPLLLDAINLLCADPLICLLSEPCHCCLVLAIVFGGSLKKLD